MRILFAIGQPHLPQAFGGAQSSTHELAVELIRRGHQIYVLSGLGSKGLVGSWARFLQRVNDDTHVRDKLLGYPTYRARNIGGSLSSLISEIAPDVAVAQAYMSIKIANEFVSSGIPTIVYFRDVESHDLKGDPSKLRGVSFISNSNFTARHYKDNYGIDSAVIPPMFRKERYLVETTEEYVTFVNPVTVKGLNLALDIVRLCPDIPFMFVESWPLSADDFAKLRAALAPHPNVVLRRRTKDMRSIYRRTKVLMMPSQWDEAWGRVASEGHFSGIPTIATNCGGLPESVGPGGTLLPRESGPEVWVSEIRRYWFDHAVYSAASNAARTYSLRPSLNPQAQLTKLVSILKEHRADAIKRARPAPNATSPGLVGEV